MAEYEKAAINTVRRKKERGVYDYVTVHRIIDITPVLHVSFTPTPVDPADDAFPVVLPMLGMTASYADRDSDSTEDGARSIYLHGYVSARMFAQEGGMPITVAATLLDGIVLAATPFNHSCNYRSAVAYGYAQPVTDPAEKMWAMQRVTDNMVHRRWEKSRVPPSSAELTSTGILRVDVRSASAKVHVGGPSIDPKDLKDPEVMGRVWTGFVPTWMSYGPLMEGTQNEVDTPAYLKEWALGEGNARRKEAFDSVVDAKGVRGVK